MIAAERATIKLCTEWVRKMLKAHCRGADWVNKTIKKKRIRQDSVISLYSEIHEDDNDMIPFILETKNDPRAKGLVINPRPELCF